jgi:hypothetical protein
LVRIFTDPSADTQNAFKNFLSNSVHSEDAEILAFRKQLNAK